ncbi:MAG: O-antigen ligase family protein [Acidobacteriia bacterium]|nr:O-antigen ligase family protein [Terriglobia bacterium]
MLLAWLLIFNHFGRPFEKILVGYRIPAALCGTAIIVLILQGSFVGFIVTRIGRAVLAFMVWMVLVTPMSSWRGGSLTYVVWYLALNGALFLILAASAGSHFGIKKLFYIAAFSCVFHIVIGGNFDPSERLNLDGTFGNADDVALLAGFALPFVLFSASQLPHLLLRILVAVPAAGFLLYCIGLTGTRSAIIGLACVLAVYLWRLNATQGMAILLLCAIAFVGMVVILPATVVSRFVTIVDSFNIEAARQQRMESEAMASVADRYDLMMDGIHMTLTHPVWGVGPGQYPHYRFMNFKYANGQPKRWFPSHNTFIQISSESGIPGIMLYLLFLGMIYKTIRNCYALCTPNSHANWKLGYQMTLCLEVSFVYFVVCAIFMTCDQHPHQFLTAGLAVALERTLAVAVRSQTATAPALAIQPRLAV